MYALQLERWFDLFGRENFKVSSVGQGGDENALEAIGPS